MEKWVIEKSGHITWKLYILPRSVCYLLEICPEVTEILDNEVMYPKNRNLLTSTITETWVRCGISHCQICLYPK